MATPTRMDWGAQLADRLAPAPNPYAGKPVEWVRERVKSETTRDQRRIMESVAVNRYTAVQSCHMIGKSWSAARLVGWWLDTHPPGSAFVVTTAPTKDQVSAVLWREIGQMHRAADLLGYVTGDDRWKIGHEGNSPEIIAYGRKPADNNPAAFSGIHARYVLVVIDEACGVPKVLYEAVDSLATNLDARVLAIGNPDDPSSYFADVCKPGSGWNVIRVDALRQANFDRETLKAYPKTRELMAREGIKPSTEPISDEMRHNLVHPVWVEERIKRWGPDSPVFISKVRGRFPKVAIDTLIHPHWIELAKAREVEPSEYMSRLGVDVARFGMDHTIVFDRSGGHARVVIDVGYGSTTDTAGRVLQYANEKYGLRNVALPVANVDDAGVGGGVVDILRESGYPVVPVWHATGSVAKLANGKPRFVNRRSELMWNLREAFAGKSGDGSDGWLDIDPTDLDLHAQLAAMKYRPNEYGQIVVESKDDYKARMDGQSPDRMDALAYSLIPDDPAMHVEQGQMITGDLLTKGW